MQLFFTLRRATSCLVCARWCVALHLALYKVMTLLPVRLNNTVQLDVAHCFFNAVQWDLMLSRRHNAGDFSMNSKSAWARRWMPWQQGSRNLRQRSNWAMVPLQLQTPVTTASTGNNKTKISKMQSKMHWERSGFKQVLLLEAWLWHQPFKWKLQQQDVPKGHPWIAGATPTNTKGGNNALADEFNHWFKRSTRQCLPQPPNWRSWRDVLLCVSGDSCMTVHPNALHKHALRSKSKERCKEKSETVDARFQDPRNECFRAVGSPKNGWLQWRATTTCCHCCKFIRFIHRKWQYQFWCCQQTLHCSVYCRAVPKLGATSSISSSGPLGNGVSTILLLFFEGAVAPRPFLVQGAVFFPFEASMMAKVQNKRLELLEWSFDSLMDNEEMRSGSSIGSVLISIFYADCSGLLIGSLRKLTRGAGTTKSLANAVYSRKGDGEQRQAKAITTKTPFVGVSSMAFWCSQLSSFVK